MADKDSSSDLDKHTARVDALKVALADRKEVADPAALIAAIGSRKQGKAAFRRNK